MIWIHGGGFSVGAGSAYDASVIVAKGDVVVVTINYRLGALGFLSTGDDKLPGNFGLWDQRLAIEWVKDNIEDYGGNPDSITLFGESAGAFSASFHMLSPLNNNSLFQRVITESGSGLATALYMPQPLTVSNSVIQQINCSVNDSLKTCLQNADSREILMATDENMYLGPVVDGDLLPHEFSRLLDSFTRTGSSEQTKSMLANFGDYDLLSGWNNQEGLFLLDPIARNLNSSAVKNGLSENIFNEALKLIVFPPSGLLGDERFIDLITDILPIFYLNSHSQLLSSNRTMDEKRLEIFTQIAGKVSISTYINCMTIFYVIFEKKCYKIIRSLIFYTFGIILIVFRFFR